MKAKDKYAATGVAARDQRFAAANRELEAKQARSNSLRAAEEARKREILRRVTARLSKNSEPDYSKAGGYTFNQALNRSVKSQAAAYFAKLVSDQLHKAAMQGSVFTKMIAANAANANRPKVQSGPILTVLDDLVSVHDHSAEQYSDLLDAAMYTACAPRTIGPKPVFRQSEEFGVFGLVATV